MNNPKQRKSKGKFEKKDRLNDLKRKKQKKVIELSLFDVH
jgi:hypothetical protein